MDSAKLATLLKPFEARCAEKGKPLTSLSLEEAYPGDSSTSYIVCVKAPWLNGMSLYDAVVFLFDILWETTDVETRENVFTIKIGQTAA